MLHILVSHSVLLNSAPPPPPVIPGNDVCGADGLSSPVTVAPVSPMPPTLTSLQPLPEDQSSFVALTPPRAFSLGGGGYPPGLVRGEGIADLFSAEQLVGAPLL